MCDMRESVDDLVQDETTVGVSIAASSELVSQSLSDNNNRCVCVYVFACVCMFLS